MEKIGYESADGHRLASSSSSFDYVIIGSGFGGAVAAPRLAEKGYRVAVLEAGLRYADADFPKTNWNLKKFLYFPAVGWRGIMRMDAFSGLLVLSGAGVGGGSLVYANTLVEPSATAFEQGSRPTRYIRVTAEICWEKSPAPAMLPAFAAGDRGGQG